MRRKARNSIVGVLLAAYLVVGALAHVEAIAQLFALGARPQTVAQSRPAGPAPAKVYWTQHKHVPAVTKASVPSPAVVSLPEPPRLDTSDLLSAVVGVPRYPAPEVSSHSSRAPPNL